MTTQLILIWLALNVALVLLLWWRSTAKPGADSARREGEPEDSPPGVMRSEDHPRGDVRTALHPRPALWPAAVAGHEGLIARPQAAGLAPCGPLLASSGPSESRLMELQAEVRQLRLTVAELSLDKARLSSALARQRC